jgi:hypothetical protein
MPLASESQIAGRVTDTNGAAVEDATVLVCPTPVTAASACLSGLHTDARGAFSASLPPGRFVVAAVKRGYDISMIQVFTRSSRLHNVRLEPRALQEPEAADARLLEPDWFLRQRRADVLREEEAALSNVAYRASPPPDGLATRGLLGPVDGDFAQSFSAQDLLSLADGASLNNEERSRTTALALRAPLPHGLAWSLEGRSARTRLGLPEEAGLLSGGSDELAIGVDYVSSLRGEMRGTLGAWFGTSSSGASRIDQRLLEGSGELSLGDAAARRLAVGVRAWDGAADLEDGAFLTLDRAPALSAEPARMAGSGYNLYAGERWQAGDRTRVDYGLEYRIASPSEELRPVPHFGMSHTMRLSGAAEIEVRSELLVDPGRPGGILAIQAVALGPLAVSASVSLLPANAFMNVAATRAGRPAAWGLPSPGQSSADMREIGIEFAGDFGPVHGSLGGSVGRAGRRSLPIIEESPLLLVSFGSERFYTTRLGVDYEPWEARMEVGYLRVESDGAAEGALAREPPPDYRRLDLLVSKVLPSPRSLLGARLRALVEWQGLGYDSVLAASGGSFLSGVSSRLSGGVGVAF